MGSQKSLVWLKLIDIVMPTNHAAGLAIRWPLIVDFSMYPLVI